MRPSGHSASQKGPKNQPKSIFGLQQFTWLIMVLVVILFLVFLAFIAWLSADSPARLVSQAEAASQAGDWITALRSWRAINATKAARSITYLGEAKACLALSRASQAEHSLHQAISADSSNSEAWRLLLEIMRVEDRIVEAQDLGWQGYNQLLTEDRSVLLRELTLGCLAELPDELVRTTLQRWVDADKADLPAHVALLERIAASPRPTDLSRRSLLTEMESVLNEHPDHIGARSPSFHLG